MSVIEGLREKVSCELVKVLETEGFSREAVVNVEPGSSWGENYLGQILRVVVTENNKQLKLILKIPHNDARRDNLHSDDLFKKEGTFYMTALPLFTQFQEDRNITLFNRTAKCYSASVEVIILEDLRQYGYKMADRMKGLQYEELKLVLTELAKFHALSFAMRDQDPQTYDSWKVLKDENNLLKVWDGTFLEKCLAPLSKETADVIENESHKQVYNSFAETFVQTLYDLTNDSDDDAFSCLNHGDCWVNNLLFTYSEENPNLPTSLKFLDFQLSRHCSPVLDLAYLIYCCTTKALRQSHLDNLLELYLETLHSSIKELGSDPEKLYPRHIFEQHMKKYMKFGLMTVVSNIPAFVADKEDIYEVTDSDLTDGLKMMRENYARLRKKPSTKERMNDVIVEMIEKQYI